MAGRGRTGRRPSRCLGRWPRRGREGGRDWLGGRRGGGGWLRAGEGQPAPGTAGGRARGGPPPGRRGGGRGAAPSPPEMFKREQSVVVHPRHHTTPSTVTARPLAISGASLTHAGRAARSASMTASALVGRSACSTRRHRCARATRAAPPPSPPPPPPPPTSSTPSRRSASTGHATLPARAARPGEPPAASAASRGPSPHRRKWRRQPSPQTSAAESTTHPGRPGGSKSSGGRKAGVEWISACSGGGMGAEKGRGRRVGGESGRVDGA